MLIRSNSLSSGNSGVSLNLLHALVALLVQDIVPLVPLRGSISASGDLSPLSYLAGVLQGNPNVKAWIGDRRDNRRLVSADVLLQQTSMEPYDLGPKEGLAIVNGTSVSAGVAALALHEAHYLALLAQILTAMGVEAMNGTTESFEQFMADVRPHPGQSDACANIRNFLKGSQLVSSPDSKEGGVLRQDRYALRTSTQWIGPQLEDLLLAHNQILIECNSTTDNPLVDVIGGKVLHGGNFQAQAVTSAVEKIRLSLQKIGRMLFAQATELVNPSLNNGLPPNLVADEPSRSFVMKSVDLACAAYMSELSYLANPVGTHVLSAELGNQSINSLALISARYTHTAVDVLSQLSAAYLYALCQALDLRAMNIFFMTSLKETFFQTLTKAFDGFYDQQSYLTDLIDRLWNAFQKEFGRTTSMDSEFRFSHIFRLLKVVFLDSGSIGHDWRYLDAMNTWTLQCGSTALEIFLGTREAYARSPDATPFLGEASARIYTHVRKELGVLFLKRDMRAIGEEPVSIGRFEEFPGYQGSTGTMMTTIYESIRSGAIYAPMMECLGQSLLLSADHPVNGQPKE